MKNIAVYVGSRANYSSAKPIIKALQKHPGLNPIVIVSGSALIPKYGQLETLMEKDKIGIDFKAYSILDGQSPGSMSSSVGLGTIQLSNILQNISHVSYALAVGDRFDVMSFVLAAIALNIPVAHTMGGERSGTIDEGLRHAISKLSSLHFVANDDARLRLIKMGEDPKFVFNTGCPRMDELVTYREEFKKRVFKSTAELYDQYKGVGSKVDLDDFILFVMHPVTTEFGDNRKVASEALSAIMRTEIPIVGIWPNADAGSEEISKEIRIFREQTQYPIHMFANLGYRDYLQLMYMCNVMVGNSSSALREGEMLGTPVVQIGTRQEARLIGANVLEVKSSSVDAINHAIVKQLKQRRYQSTNLYGSGKSSETIASYLDKIEIKNSQKLNFY